MSVLRNWLRSFDGSALIGSITIEMGFLDLLPRIIEVLAGFLPLLTASDPAHFDHGRDAVEEPLP